MGAGPTYTDGSVSPSRPFCLGWLSFGCSRQWTAQPWSLLTARCPRHVTAAAIGIRTAPVVLRVPRLLPRAKHTFHLTISYDKASHRVGSLGPTAKIWGVFCQTTRKSFGVQRWVWITNQGVVKTGRSIRMVEGMEPNESREWRMHCVQSDVRELSRTRMLLAQTGCWPSPNLHNKPALVPMEAFPLPELLEGPSSLCNTRSNRRFCRGRCG